MGGIGSGGARQGAGRPRQDKEKVSFCLPSGLLIQARRESERIGTSLSAYLSEIMEKGMAR